MFLLRRPLQLSLPIERWRKLLYAIASATAALLLIRVAIYGNLGGYPNVQGTGTANFVFNSRTITSMFTKMPASLFLINTRAGLPLWLKLTLIAYVLLLATIVLEKGTAGRRTWMILLAFVAAVPAANMIGWMTPWAQQGRYVSHSAIWIVFLLVWTLRSVRFSSVLLPAWVAIFAIAAFFNTLPYVRMMRVIKLAAHEATAACENTNCRALVLENLPRDYEGAFYFGFQVVHDVRAALPNVTVLANTPVTPTSAVVLRWSDGDRWVEEGAHSTLRLNDSGRAGKRVRYAPAAG
ncbi:MAG: hypothetical protein JO061_11710 [Acidobacteriaceae bacterium]|nr:hypothetical protein [Acidobacteriaceae bacterium]